MALEAVVYQQDLFGFNGKDLYNLVGGNWSYDHFGLEREEDKGFLQSYLQSSSPHSMVNELLHHQPTPSLDANNANGSTPNDSQQVDASADMQTRPKRRRSSNSRRNKEDIENQRMTHIAVERNRRKQMNDYLSILRSLMPDSYVQRGDQASIIGGAINFVKELEHKLQLIGGHKEIKGKSESNSSLVFSEFFTFPQYSTCSSSCNDSAAMGDSQSAIADIEVTMVESHANLKIRSKRRPKQLLKMVSGLHTMRLNILHLNVTTVDQIVLYSLSVKVEDDCKLTSVDDIATAMYQLLGRIQEESLLN
ncbi:HLH domain-containing protein [Cephalotus follicularis]|uniref:HLH domain-containing protein n=1 Tax=Cephalotus follicularis TaxID=3775 RepID=A0A1Q3B5B0_CEPFO|nr:HLH domain-containing protein [Cephalotus follicularis]